ncbi:MAG TPA: N-6 DNA methylase [Candidatus Dojkabacteria bacterium]|nr:N-6 DNA methylase [Candidatus Dojkabacteria bacterium]
MARGTSSTQSELNNKIIDQLHNIIRAGGINNYVLRVDFIAILYLMRRFEEELRMHRDEYIGDVFYGEYDTYRFSRLNEITDATKLQNFLNNDVIPFYKNIPELVQYVKGAKPSIYETNFYKYTSEFFRDASIQKLKSGRLKEVISLVSDIESSTILSDDFLGDAVESAFANSTASERKQMGLFRTPKHIRDLMVQLTAPSIKDKIYDPAVGTGGFLTSAKNYIFDNADISKISEKDLQKFYFDGLGGMEQDMFLHRFAMMVALTNQANPLNIKEGDSLGEFDYSRDRESYSLILTNPPFGGKKNQDHYSNLWAMNSSETTVLFLKLMYELLLPNGRCATVVSEGMNTWGDATAVEMRRVISEECTLDAVISLPQGVFQNPKGGIGPKTSIYLFHKEKPLSDHKVFFYQITNDGYSIGTNRKQIDGSQLSDLLDKWDHYKSGKLEQVESENCVLIPINKIKENEIYSFNISSYLSGISTYLVNDYKEQAKSIQQQLTQLTKPLENIQKQISSLTQPIRDMQKELIEATKIMQIQNWKFKEDLILIDKELKESLVAVSKISVPQIEVHLPDFSKLICDYQSLAQNVLKRGNSYPLIPLRDLVIANENKIKPLDFPEDEFSVLGVSNTKGVFLNEKLKGFEIKQPYYKVNKLDFCYNPYRINVGSIGLNQYDLSNQIISGAYLVFSCDKSKILPLFLNEIFKTKKFLDYVNEKASGAVRMNFKYEFLEDFKIPLPPIEKQEELVSTFKRNRNIIKSCNEIIKDWQVVIPESSEKRKLKDFIIDCLYGISSPLKESGSITVLRMNNISINGDLLTDDLKFTDDVLPKERMLSPNDFLFNRTNSIDLVGKSTVVTDDFNGTWAGYLIRLKLNEGLDPKYIAFLFATRRYRDLFKRIAKQAGNQANINAKQLEEIVIDYYPIEKQREFVKDIQDEKNYLRSVNLLKEKSLSSIRKIINSVWNED